MLNARAAKICDSIIAEADILRVGVSRSASGATIIDCGATVRGGLEAGRRLAEVCLAGLGQVTIQAGRQADWRWPTVTVATDAPVAACLASQYAGWKVQSGKFFAMGSGPMRAAIGKEDIYDTIGFRETSERAVGVLETRKLPTDEAIAALAESCHLTPDRLTLLVAPTASQAGSVQIAARSVETALHKLHELGFDLTRIESGLGAAPLPPVAADDLAAIGRTNDAILYGAQVWLWVRGNDDSLRAIGPRLPSSASRDYGLPFVEIFRRYNGDFYEIDPLLFSPARIDLINVDTGATFSFGQTSPTLLQRSFSG